jgi:hypothetical protein
VGDRIELGGVKGDVIDIRLFQTSLLEIGNWVDADQSTGRIVHVPNSTVFKEENYNYSRRYCQMLWMRFLSTHVRNRFADCFDHFIHPASKARCGLDILASAGG